MVHAGVGKTTVVVNLCKPTPMPTVVTSPVAGAGSPNRLAKVALHAGSTYDWTISNGTITSGLGTNAIVFTAGNPGPLTLSVVERDPAFSNIPSLPGTAREDVLQRGFATQAYTVSPCRLLDTRNESSKDGLGGPPLGPDERRLFTPSLSSCGVPSTAAALLVNVTVVRPSALGDLVVWGDGTPGGERALPSCIFRPD